jgi:SAM-dependent methyltransferase
MERSVEATWATTFTLGLEGTRREHLVVTDDFTRHTRKQDVGRWHISRFVEDVSRQIPAGSSVLDAGAGESVYRHLFSHCDYKALDLAVGDDRWNYEGLDYVAPLDDMPIPDASFDAVICTQVLEHTERPQESVAEMFRVLRPGGRLFITAPMAQSEHQTPYDFFRFTSFGLRSLCTRAGFAAIELTAFGGRWTRWAYELPEALAIFPTSGLRTGRPDLRGLAMLPARQVMKALISFLQSVFFWLDRVDRRRDFPFGWACVATK